MVLMPLSTIFQLRSVLLVEETGVPRENRVPVHFTMNYFDLTTLVVIGTDCTGSCKSNYLTITTRTASKPTGKYLKYTCSYK